jgi:hypothetical protein
MNKQISEGNFYSFEEIESAKRLLRKMGLVLLHYRCMRTDSVFLVMRSR